MEEQTHWHLKKEVNLSHLLVTATLAIGLVAWGNKMDQRITTAEVRLSALQDTMVQERIYQSERHRELLLELRALRTEMTNLNRRLDSRDARP